MNSMPTFVEFFCRSIHQPKMPQKIQTPQLNRRGFFRLGPNITKLQHKKRLSGACINDCSGTSAEKPFGGK